MIQILSNYGNLLLRAMGQTLLLALCGLLFGTLLGMFFGILSVVKNKVCQCHCYDFCRCSARRTDDCTCHVRLLWCPLLSQYHDGLQRNPDGASGRHYLSCTELRRLYGRDHSCRHPVCRQGQMEAARSLGLPYWRAMERVVLPQAIRTMVPSIINQFIITLKDTSILSVIGFPELVNTAKNVVANTFKSFQVWAIVGIMYLIIILILSKAAKRLERSWSRGRQ